VNLTLSLKCSRHNDYEARENDTNRTCSSAFKFIGRLFDDEYSGLIHINYLAFRGTVMR